MTFPEIESILLNRLPLPRIGVLQIPQVISSFDNTPELIEIDLKKDNYFYQLHTDGPISFDLDFRMQFGMKLQNKSRHFFCLFLNRIYPS